MPEPLTIGRQLRAPGRERQRREVLTIEVQQVEGVVDDDVLRVGGAMLECLERGSARAVQRNHLAVEDCAPRLQLLAGGMHRRIRARQVLVVARPDLDPLAGLEQDARGSRRT